MAALVGCASPTGPRQEVAAVATGPSPVESSAAGPRFAAEGPDADEYGAREGYRIKGIPRAPFLVGAFSHYDEIFEGRLVRRATNRKDQRATLELALASTKTRMTAR